jgi:hypothetical protein
VVDDHALKLVKITPLTDPPTNIEFDIDHTTDFYKFLSVEGRRLSVKNGFDKWFPVLLAKAPIQNRKFFEVEITKVGNKCMMLGVTVFEYRNKKCNYTL